ncbi:MAG: amidase family protein, partial [Giesbergeria sp.]
MAKDLDSALRMLQAGATDAEEEMAACVARAQAPECRHAFSLPLFDEALREAADPELARRPLAGLSVSVKDLFDMQGITSTAGSTVLATE